MLFLLLARSNSSFFLHLPGSPEREGWQPLGARGVRGASWRMSAPGAEEPMDCGDVASEVIEARMRSIKDADAAHHAETAHALLRRLNTGSAVNHVKSARRTMPGSRILSL